MTHSRQLCIGPPPNVAPAGLNLLIGYLAQNLTGGVQPPTQPWASEGLPSAGVDFEAAPPSVPPPFVHLLSGHLPSSAVVIAIKIIARLISEPAANSQDAPATPCASSGASVCRGGCAVGRYLPGNDWVGSRGRCSLPGGSACQESAAGQEAAAQAPLAPSQAQDQVATAQDEAPAAAPSAVAAA
jgi:hypothetical protein